MHRRAIYNLIHLNDADARVEVEPWQKENYRILSDAEIFKRLKELGVETTDLQTFIHFAEEFESPDEMSDACTRGKEQQEQDASYLCLFELWRRHLPEKRCPSVFCDELDYQLTQYERGNLDLQEELQEILDYFEQILDDHVDEGADPQAVLSSFQQYCAHHLERFLFNYTLDAIESGNCDYAYDLIDGFYRYVDEPIWFDYLYARVLIKENPQKGCETLSLLIKKVHSLPFAEEILVYLVQERNHTLFCQLALKTLPLLEKEEEFKEFLDLCSLHFENLALEDHQNAFHTLIEKRKEIAPDARFEKGDVDRKEVKKLINQKSPVSR